MYKKLFLFLTFPIFLYATELVNLPFFTNILTTNFYCGQNIDVVNKNPFEAYTVFQYMYDFGFQGEQKKIRETDQTVSFSAMARMKGVLGNLGSGLVPLQETAKFEIWMRELFLKYMPLTNKNYFLQVGFFPFKIGNGFVLGNAYDINIPIEWQYVYEQINQFRPGILLQLGNEKKTVSASFYSGFFLASNATPPLTSAATLDTFTDNVLRELNAPLINWGKGFVLATQIDIGPFEQFPLQTSPYLCFIKNNQFVEAPDDAVTKLGTGGINFHYTREKFEINLEFARNFGHQNVHAVDRNLIIPIGKTVYNTQLFYAPNVNPNTAQSTVSHSQFVASTYNILPSSYAAQYGNGGSFLFPVDPSSTFIFQNSYDRYRKAYTNTCAGYLLYGQFLIKKDILRWGFAGAYVSGDESPNDSLVTILLTRRTPNVQYKDYNKTYKGFLGINQFSEASGVGALYFGPGIYRLTNLGVIGSSIGAVKNKFGIRGSWASYFKPFAPFVNVIDQNGMPFNVPLPHYVGTELNGGFSYTVNNYFSFSFLTGVFLPGGFYQALKDQSTLIEQDTLALLEPTKLPLTKTPMQKVAYFVNFSLIWQFDSTDIVNFLNKNLFLQYK